MNTKKTLFLAIVLAALAMFVFLYELPHQRGKEQAELEGDKILDISFEAISRVELERDGEKLSFAKDAEGDTWTMTAPVQDETERWVVQSLISAIRYAKPTRKIEAPDAAALERFGLTTPLAVIAFDTGEVIKRVRVGGENQVGATIYVKPEDEAVAYLVNKSSLAALEKPVADFRRKDLLTPEDRGRQLNRLTIQRANAKGVLGAKLELFPEAAEDEQAATLPSDKNWRIGSPTGPIVDQEEMKNILDKVATIKAAEFFDKPDLDFDYGLEAPELVVTARYQGEGEDAEPTDLTLTVGAKKKIGAAFFARAAGRTPIVTVHAGNVEPLFADEQTLRDRSFFGALNPEQVAIVDLQSPGASFRVSRSADGWQFADQQPADAEAIENLLGTVMVWRAEQLVDGYRGKRLARAVRGSGVTTVTLQDTEGRQLQRVSLSGPVEPAKLAPAKAGRETPLEGKHVIALLSGGYADTVYVAKADVLSGLPQSIADVAPEPVAAAATPESTPEAEEAADQATE
jgi:Domain of unknown function (DUF4340)